MEQSELAVRDAMSLSRHDFLNDLQLILMHLDLENIPEARRHLLRTTEKMRSESQLSALKLPKLETWILTVEWNYSVFTKQLVTDVTSNQAVRKADDHAVVTSLHNLFQQLAANADPYGENIVELNVFATEERWEVSISLPGQMAPIEWNECIEADWVSELSEEKEYWTFTYRGQ